MTRSPYATNKLAAHPEQIARLAKRAPGAPIFIHWSISSTCNQACRFCSYGSGPEALRNQEERARWKNADLLFQRDQVPLPKALEIIRDCRAMGIKGFEMTGGGEPTAHKHFESIFGAMSGLDVGLVTNGVQLTKDRADLMRSLPFTWARVSIDAGTEEDYIATRQVPEAHWKKAWQAVEHLAAAKTLADQRVGVAFTASNENNEHVYEFVSLAKDHGADNVRLSAAFTPDHKAWFREGALDMARAQGMAAKMDFEDDTFQVNNLIGERAGNVEALERDYQFCAFKEVLCFLGADCNIYSCCTFAHNKRGIMGECRTKSFREAWETEVRIWQREHDAVRDCGGTACLYDKRNRDALALIDEHRMSEPLHKVFV